MVKNQKGEVLVDSHIILNRWSSHFSQIMYMGLVVRQTEIHTAEPLVPEPNAWDGCWKPKKIQMTRY